MFWSVDSLPFFSLSSKTPEPKGLCKHSKHSLQSLLTVVSTFPAVHIVCQSGPLTPKQPLVC